MCGIAGVIKFDGPFRDRETLESMTTALAHRGPDGEGFHLDGPVGLGHRRLAILDLSETGRQPMSNEDGSVWITYNGEIYNSPELRSLLEKKGHLFRSTSDTEVVIHAYEEWGFKCLERLTGMFAFGLWDSTRQRLWLVRDRLGIKPLFYARLKDGLIFGSEIKALLAHPGLDRTPDPVALDHLLALNYAPAPWTLFKQVRQLEPGRFAVIQADGGFREEEYWDLNFREDNGGNLRDWTGRFRELAGVVVGSHLLSDVPFGAFLSGGLDSAGVVHWMSQALDSPVTAFTARFEEPTFDESPQARQVARLVGADHHQILIKEEIAADPENLFRRLVHHSEEPLADSSMAAVHELARAARKKVKMVLTGDGGDEILAGYETYQAHYLLRLLQLFPAFLTKPLFKGLDAALPVSDAKIGLGFKLRIFGQHLDQTPEEAHCLWRTIFTREARAGLLASDWLSGGMGEQGRAGPQAPAPYLAQFGRTDARRPLNRMLYADTRFYLPNDMLIKVDRMTMAHGLEARVPLLDHRLVEFCAQVPVRFKLRYLMKKKYLLKKALTGRLPGSLINRRKAGFNIPMGRWFKEEWRDFVADTLSPSALEPLGLFNTAIVEGILKAHFQEREDNSFKIWSLITLVTWWRMFQSGEAAR